MTQGLRALIEAKQRRITIWPLLVGDLRKASREVGLLRDVLAVQQAEREQRGPRAKANKAEQDTERALAAALERQAACVVEVELQALPDDEWDALFGDLEPDENGELDLDPIHALLLAASCTDPELQDAEWWTGQLGQPQWSKGDRAALSQTLLALNLGTPTGVPGKG